jgi:hypothetical protein
VARQCVAVTSRFDRGVPAVIERFEVPPGEDDAFLDAWAAAGEPGARLLRALRAPHRFIAISGGGEVVREQGDPDVAGGVWRIAVLDAEPGEWPSGRQGFLGARLYRDGARYVEIQRWSSPLMVQRAGQSGDLYLAVGP